MLGEGINPQMFVNDFSGFTRAAEMQAQGMANLGQSIGGTIGKIGDQMTERKKEQALQMQEVKRAENIGKIIAETMPEYADMVNPSLAKLSDQNIPLAERVIEAMSITDGFKTRLDLEGLKRERQMDAMRMQKMQMSMQPAPAAAATAEVPTIW